MPLVDVAGLLAPQTATPFFVEISRDDKLHLRYRVGHRTVDDGRCGVDDNWRQVEPGYVAEADRDRFCGFCVPR